MWPRVGRQTPVESRYSPPRWNVPVRSGHTEPVELVRAAVVRAPVVLTRAPAVRASVVLARAPAVLVAAVVVLVRAAVVRAAVVWARHPLPKLNGRGMGRTVDWDGITVLNRPSHSCNGCVTAGDPSLIRHGASVSSRS